MSSFFIGAKNRVLKGEAAPKGKRAREGFSQGKSPIQKGSKGIKGMKNTSYSSGNNPLVIIESKRKSIYSMIV